MKIIAVSIIIIIIILDKNNNYIYERYYEKNVSRIEGRVIP